MLRLKNVVINIKILLSFVLLRDLGNIYIYIYIYIYHKMNNENFIHCFKNFWYM